MMHIQGAAASDKPRRTLHSKNKKWVSGQEENGQAGDGERWERGTHRRRGRGRGGLSQHGAYLTVPTDLIDEGTSATEDEGASGDSGHEDDGEQAQPEPETPEEREKFYQEVRKYSFTSDVSVLGTSSYVSGSPTSTGPGDCNSVDAILNLLRTSRCVGMASITCHVQERSSARCYVVTFTEQSTRSILACEATGS